MKITSILLDGITEEDTFLAKICGKNGTFGIVGETNRQNEILTKVEEALTSNRYCATTGGTNIDAPSGLMLIIQDNQSSGGETTHYLPTGNYKILGRLTVNKVTVAEDYFVFNVNRTIITDRFNIPD